MFWLLAACGSAPAPEDDTGATDTDEPVDTDTDTDAGPADTSDTGVPPATGTTTDADGCVTDHDQPLDADCPCWTVLDATLAVSGATDTGDSELPDAPCVPPAVLAVEDQTALEAAMSLHAPDAVLPSVDFASREAVLFWASCNSASLYEWEHARVCEADGRAVFDFRRSLYGPDVPSRPYWVLDLPRAAYSGIEARIEEYLR